MKNNVYGYVVVKLPEFVGECWNDKPINFCGLQGEKIQYTGLDRDPWWDIDDLFYADILPEEYTMIRQHINKSMFFSFSPGVCYDFKAVQSLLDLCNQSTNSNEIIRIAAIGEFSESTIHEDIGCTLGYDCYADGYGSLIRLGLFQKADIFSDFLPKLNKNGLFKEFSHLTEYIQAYNQCAINNNLEPVDTECTDITIYLVSRLIVVSSLLIQDVSGDGVPSTN